MRYSFDDSKFRLFFCFDDMSLCWTLRMNTVDKDSSATLPEQPSPTPAAGPRRRGDVCKCPICGSANDPEAFYCVKCRNYFCFHCRARSLPSEPQWQCVNQDCDYYGKLVCSVCNPVSEQDEPPSIYSEPQDGYWPAWLALHLVVAAFLWYFSSSFLGAALIAAASYIGGGYWLQKKAGWNLFGQERKVEQHRKSSFHTCIKCQQRVKELRKGN